MNIESVRDYLLKEQENFSVSEKVLAFALILGFVLDRCKKKEIPKTHLSLHRRIKLIEERLDKSLDFRGGKLADFIYFLPRYIEELDFDIQIEFMENVQGCIGVPKGWEKETVMLAAAMGMVVDSIFYSDEVLTMKEICMEKAAELTLFPAVHEYGLSILNSRIEANHLANHRQEYLGIEEKLRLLRKMMVSQKEDSRVNSTEYNPSKITEAVYGELEPILAIVDGPKENDPTLYNRSKRLIDFVKNYSDTKELERTLEIARKDLYHLL